MLFSSNRNKPLSPITKVCYGILIIVFLLLGLIGLILPVIPGLLFLFLAVLLMTRVSRRAAAFAENHRGFDRHKRTWDAAGKLSMAQRLKLSFWLTSKALVGAAESGIEMLRKTFKMS